MPSEVELVLDGDGDVEELAEGEVGLDERQVGWGARVHRHACEVLAVLLLHLVFVNSKICNSQILTNTKDCRSLNVQTNDAVPKVLSFHMPFYALSVR